MRIAECYSHLNGLEFILCHKPHLWREINALIQGVDTRLAQGQGSGTNTVRMSPEDRRRVIDAFRRSLKARGWTRRRTGYWVTKNAKLMQRTVDLSPPQQEAEIIAVGEQPTRSFNQTDFVKDRVAVEVQFGKYFAVAYDLFVKHLAFYVGDVIDVGVEIVPMKSFAASTVGEGGKRTRKMSTGVPWYEKELYNLIREGRGVPGVPLVIVGVQP